MFRRDRSLWQKIIPQSDFAYQPLPKDQNPTPNSLLGERASHQSPTLSPPTINCQLTTVANALNGAVKVCCAAGIGSADPVTALTRKRIDLALDIKTITHYYADIAHPTSAPYASLTCCSHAQTYFSRIAPPQNSGRGESFSARAQMLSFAYQDAFPHVTNLKTSCGQTDSACGQTNSPCGQA